MIPGLIRREVRYRYWCHVCLSGSPGAYLTRGECDPWQAMHERTNYHADRVAHFVFHHLNSLLDADSKGE
jgi:hypothetical protein